MQHSSAASFRKTIAEASKLTVDDILSALELSRFAIRDYVTRQINLKYSPEIRFYYDPTFENFETIEKLLKK